MYFYIGVIQLLILTVMLFKYLKSSGIVVFADGIKLMLFLWLANIGLYNISISKLYNPNYQINIVVIFICIIFFLVGRRKYIKAEDIKISMKEIEDNKEDYIIYKWITNILFLVAFLVFWKNTIKHGLAIFDENKIDKQVIDHYDAYIIYMLVVVAQIKYILFRAKRSFAELIMFILSLGTLMLTLNRGPIAFIVASCYIYEIFNLIKNKDRMSKKILYSIYGGFILVGLIFIYFFGVIGDMRMEYVLNNILHKTINEHYLMPTWVPSGILWIYIYLTSPLENAAFAIAGGGVNFTFFNNLFYPFIKLFANIIGKGEAYKQWLISRGSYQAYLDEEVGLNATSFITDGMQDLGYIGLIVYILIFLALAYLGVQLIKKRIASSIGSIIIYANIINILLWSVFSNSLRIPTLILYILFIGFVEVLRKVGVFNRFFNLLNRR